jgi:hypothetical protein
LVDLKQPAGSAWSGTRGAAAAESPIATYLGPVPGAASGGAIRLVTADASGTRDGIGTAGASLQADATDVAIRAATTVQRIRVEAITRSYPRSPTVPLWAS